MKNEGTTVFLNSHLLSEVEAVCDSVTFIQKGSVVKSARMDELLMTKILLTIRAHGITEELFSTINKQHPSLQKLADGSLIVSLNDYEKIPALAASLISNGVTLYELTPHRETLETVFMQIVGEEGQSS